MPIDPDALRIILYPAEILRTRAEEIPEVTDEVRALARRMLELMREAQGIGLAAPQVGVSWRLFVAHVPEDEQRSERDEPPTVSPEPEVFINPRIIEPRGEMHVLEEGCLSLPSIRGDVIRPDIVTIEALDLEGQPFTRHGAGLLARCWQHELDHLDGVLIIDRFTQMSRLKNRAALRTLQRKAHA